MDFSPISLKYVSNFVDHDMSARLFLFSLLWSQRRSGLRGILKHVLKICIFLNPLVWCVLVWFGCGRQVGAMSSAVSARCEQGSEVRRCGRRVGLTASRCRCGKIFCVVHRLSEKHECEYDYRSNHLAKEDDLVSKMRCVADKI